VARKAAATVTIGAIGSGVLWAVLAGTGMTETFLKYFPADPFAQFLLQLVTVATVGVSIAFLFRFVFFLLVIVPFESKGGLQAILIKRFNTYMWPIAMMMLGVVLFVGFFGSGLFIYVKAELKTRFATQDQALEGAITSRLSQQTAQISDLLISTIPIEQAELFRKKIVVMQTNISIIKATQTRFDIAATGMLQAIRTHESYGGKSFFPQQTRGIDRPYQELLELILPIMGSASPPYMDAPVEGEESITDQDTLNYYRKLSFQKTMIDSQASYVLSQYEAAIQTAKSVIMLNAAKDIK
jgi:hypothetical protein